MAANTGHDLNRMCPRAGFSGSAGLVWALEPRACSPASLWSTLDSEGPKLQCRHQRHQAKPTIRAGVMAWKRCTQQGFITQHSTRETNLRNWQAGINCWRQDPLQNEHIWTFSGWTYFLCSGGLISPCTGIIYTRFSQLLLLPDSKSLLSVIYEDGKHQQ